MKLENTHIIYLSDFASYTYFGTGNPSDAYKEAGIVYTDKWGRVQFALPLFGLFTPPQIF